MAVTKYSYSKDVNNSKLKEEISQSLITIALDHIEANGSALDIFFKDALPDKTLLDAIVTSHVNTPSISIQNPTDSDGSMIVRQKIAKTGKTYHQIYFSFVTSVGSSLFQNDYLGNSMDVATLKLFKDDGAGGLVETVIDSEAVMTQVDFVPKFDYEIIGGQVRIDQKPTQNVVVYVVAVPDIPYNMGGSKPMVCGANFKFFGSNDPIIADGKAVKNMQFVTTGLPDGTTNKIRFNIKHHRGVTHDILAMMEVFH